MGVVTVTIQVVDDEAIPAIMDGVLVRVFDATGTTFLASGITGTITPGEVDFSLTGDVPGINYLAFLSKDGVSFLPAPSKPILVTDPPNPNNTFQFAGHIGLQDVIATVVVRDESLAPVEGIRVRIFDAGDTFVTELDTSALGEAVVVLPGAVSPGLGYILRITPAAGSVVQGGPTQTISVIDPLSGSETNIFDFILEALPTIPVSDDPDMCKVSGYFSNPSLQALRDLTMIFHPSESYPETFVSGAPFGGDPAAIRDRVIASERRVVTNRNGYVEFDLPRKGVFDVYFQGLDAPNLSLLSPVFVPDTDGIRILELIYPYVTKVTYDSAAVPVAAGESATLDFVTETSNLQPLTLEGVNSLLEFTVDDGAVASVTVTGAGELTVTGIAAGTATISVARRPLTAAPRRPALSSLIILPSEPLVTVT